jgi:hypothetical protein
VYKHVSFHSRRPIKSVGEIGLDNTAAVGWNTLVAGFVRRFLGPFTQADARELCGDLNAEVRALRQVVMLNCEPCGPGVPLEIVEI